METPNGTHVLERAINGDSDAFGALVEPHLPMFYNAIYRILGDRADSQDALQDALMAIHRDLPKFEGRSAFSSWAYRVCINNALMVRRARVRRKEDAMEDLVSQNPDEGRPMDADASLRWSTDPDAFNKIEHKEMREKMMAVLDKMSDAHRVVFILKDLEDWTTEAIAEHLEISASVVRQRLHRGRLFVLERMRPFVLGRPT
ncbi:MAG: RNA polymerase sigma factor [Holophagaceae bacterium]|nr:RNA polymerase sigma factor [Holophagaceae bacterium]